MDSFGLDTNHSENFRPSNIKGGNFDNNNTREDIIKENKLEDVQANNKLAISPKAAFGILVFLGGATLLLGFINLSRNVYYKPKYASDNVATGLAQEQNTVQDLLELQGIDTDKDGLSDYDEMYIYKTSPYLPDTDSDGYLDKQEIDNGYDPLCPAGQDCDGTPQDQNSSEETTRNSSVNNLDGNPTLPADSQNQEFTPELMDELKNLTPDQIRDLLRSSGQMTEEQINAIDDETLMQVYREVLNISN